MTSSRQVQPQGAVPVSSPAPSAEQNPPPSTSGAESGSVAGAAPKMKTVRRFINDVLEAGNWDIRDAFDDILARDAEHEAEKATLRAQLTEARRGLGFIAEHGERAFDREQARRTLDIMDGAAIPPAPTPPDAACSDEAWASASASASARPLRSWQAVPPQIECSTRNGSYDWGACVKPVYHDGFHADYEGRTWGQMPSALGTSAPKSPTESR